jgi:hypothetical protein
VIDALAAEVALRALMWGFIDDLETDVVGLTSARRWTDQGSLELICGDERVLAVGAAEVAKALDDESEHPPAVMRVLFSGVIDPMGDRAYCRWRDLWTACRRGEAVWLAHNYEIAAARQGGEWKFDTMVRRRVLDCPYETGWASMPPIGVDGIEAGAER